MHIDALSVLCAQLTRDLLAIAKFLFESVLMLFTQNYQKVRAWVTNYSIPKVARFFQTQCSDVNAYHFMMVQKWNW